MERFYSQSSSTANEVGIKRKRKSIEDSLSLLLISYLYKLHVMTIFNNRFEKALKETYCTFDTIKYYT